MARRGSSACVKYPELPQFMVIAEDGDELTAVQSMRLGAVDYLPRRLITPELLRAGITLCLEQQTARDDAGSGTGQLLPPRAATSLPRELIPRYTLLDTLGESPRATVYLATSEALNRNVALKVSHVSETDEAQFSREYAAIGAMRHPAVVDIYDYGVFDGREYIAMEYFPCGDLKARMQNPDHRRRGPRLPASASPAALSVIHGEGILHRDLKPPNIMLREDGQVVLIDFGLAKNLHSGTRSTAAGVLRGSPYYMSPEQAQGEELDSRSDLYSLGVIFFEMLTGSQALPGHHRLRGAAAACVRARARTSRGPAAPPGAARRTHGQVARRPLCLRRRSAREPGPGRGVNTDEHRSHC